MWEDHKSYNFIKQCFQNTLEITYENKEKLIEHLERLAGNKECQKYYHVPDDLVLTNTEYKNDNKESKGSKGVIPVTTPTSFAPQFDQGIFNRLVKNDSLPISTTDTSLFTPQFNNTEVTRYNGNTINSTTTPSNEHSNVVSAFLPVAFLIAIFIFVRFIFCKLQSKEKHRTNTTNREQQTALQEVGIERSQNHIIRREGSSL